MALIMGLVFWSSYLCLRSVKITDLASDLILASLNFSPLRDFVAILEVLSEDLVSFFAILNLGICNWECLLFATSTIVPNVAVPWAGAGELLGEDQSCVSDLVMGYLNKFSVDMLISR